MTEEVEKLLRQALALPNEARGALAASWIESLDEEVDEDAEAEWAVEIARRIEEVGSGAIRMIPWPEARRMILEGGDGRENP